MALSQTQNGVGTLDEKTAVQHEVTVDAKVVDTEYEDEEVRRVRNRAWGKHGLILIWVGIALMWIIFELDNTTVYNYQNYATSEFASISYLGTLTTAGIIISAVLKPPIAKISDVVGRAQVYAATVVLYILSYILCASAHAFDQYSVGYIIYCIGQTGMQILNQIIVADITTSRWRGLANGLVNLPFMVLPLIAAFIVDSALKTVGWRWGIGMFAIVLPVCSMAVVIPLFMFQRRMAALGASTKPQLSVTPCPRRAPAIWDSIRGFCSHIDLGGTFLLATGFALVLLPLSLAGNAPSRWSTPWIPALIAVGVILLLSLLFYEYQLAKHPILPWRFLRISSLVLAWAIGITDSFAYSATHTYMFPWATVVHSFSARDATFLINTAAVMQVFSGAICGLLMYKTRRYKWLIVIGVVIRVVGYGVMLRLRGANNSTAEIFIVQLIQGTGSGFILTIVLVIAQIVVPRAELAQSTAIELLFIYLGNGLGSAVAGALYTSLFKGRLQFHFPNFTTEQIEAVYNTITESQEVPGSVQAVAINDAYSDVMRCFTYVGLALSVVPFFCVWWLKDLRLNDRHNLSETIAKGEEEIVSANEGKWKRWWRTGNYN